LLGGRANPAQRRGLAPLPHHRRDRGGGGGLLPEPLDLLGAAARERRLDVLQDADHEAGDPVVLADQLDPQLVQKRTQRRPVGLGL
jgi:hypothetical protein